MQGHAPIALRKGHSATCEATGSTGQPGHVFEDAGWKRELASIEHFPERNPENPRSNQPSGQPREATALHTITDCMTINQLIPSIPQMQSVASSMCSTVAAAPFHMGAW